LRSEKRKFKEKSTGEAEEGEMAWKSPEEWEKEEARTTEAPMKARQAAELAKKKAAGEPVTKVERLMVQRATPLAKRLAALTNTELAKLRLVLSTTDYGKSIFKQIKIVKTSPEALVKLLTSNLEMLNIVGRLVGALPESFHIDYAKAILEDEELEKMRLEAHDLSGAALDLYIKRCNDLGRQSLSQMYDNDLQEAFQMLIEDTSCRYESYQQRLSLHGLRFGHGPVGNLFEVLVEMYHLSKDPLDHSDWIRQFIKNPQVVTESYRNGMIISISGNEYVSISNVI